LMIQKYKENEKALSNLFFLGLFFKKKWYFIRYISQ
jgi:hypothetical protein